MLVPTSQTKAIQQAIAMAKCSVGLDKVATKSRSKLVQSFSHTQRSKEIKGHIQIRRKKNFRVKIGLGKRGSYVYGPERGTVHECYQDLKEVHQAPSRLEDISKCWQDQLGSYIIPSATQEAAAWRWLALSFAPLEIVPLLSCLRASEVTLLAKDLKLAVINVNKDLPPGEFSEFEVDKKAEEFIFDGGNPKYKGNCIFEVLDADKPEASVCDNQDDDKEDEDDEDYEDESDIFISASQSSASSSSSGQGGPNYEDDCDMSSTESSSD